MKRRTLWLAGAAVAVAATLAGTLSWVLAPRVDAPQPTDATVLLASPGGIAAVTRHQLDAYPGRIILSVTKEQMQMPAYREACSGRNPRVEACLTPDPLTTRGEARSFAEYARDKGWRSVTVVTHRSHISRSRLLFNRCFDGEVRMQAVDTEPAGQLFGAYFYEVGALGKALVLQGC